MESYRVIKACLDFLMLIVLVMIAVKDIKTRIIDPKLLYVIIIISIGAAFANKEFHIIKALSSTGAIFIALSAIYILSRRAIGWGDVKLCTCVAFYLGFERAFSTLIYAVMLCGLWAFVLLLLKKTLKSSEIPFAPFVSAGVVITAFVGL